MVLGVFKAHRIYAMVDLYTTALLSRFLIGKVST